MKYTKEFKLNCVKLGNCTIGDQAKQKNVPKQTIARWIKLYNQFGHEGLEEKKRGVSQKPINPEIENKVLNLWEQKNRSAYKMYKDLSKMSFSDGVDKHSSISKREIYRIYKKHNLKIPE